MRLLLDTHVLLWAVKGTLGKHAQSLIEDSSNELYFSAVNIWEIQLKRDKLKISTQVLFEKLIENGYRPLEITPRHVLTLDSLPTIHQDPFDRMLLAQALSESLYLLTADETMQAYAKYLDCVLFAE